MIDEPGGRLKLLYVNDLAADRSCSDQRKVSFRIFECIRRSAVSDLHKVESSRLDSGLLPIRNAQHDDDAGSKHLPSPCDSTSPPPLPCGMGKRTWQFMPSVPLGSSWRNRGNARSLFPIPSTS